MQTLPKLTRRSIFRLGGLSVAGYGLLPMAAPLNVYANSKVAPRGGADAVIFINLLGGPSQMDTFDVKEGNWGPEDRDIRTTKQGYQWPRGFFPKLEQRLDDLLIVRSMEAWETVHSRGQYYLQTGHAVSPARVQEMPSMGAVIAYESLANRKPEHFLPPFVSMNYEGTTMYGPLIREGCLENTCAPLTLDLKNANLPFAVPPEERERFDRRWKFLNEFDSSRKLAPGAPREMADFASYAEAAHRMMENPRMSEILRLDPDARKTYGSTPIGDACLLAKNMVEADAGAKFLMLTHADWDHHGNIYGKPGGPKGGVYKLCPELDAALAALLADLKSTRTKDGQHSLLDRTFVVVMGEFGRTPGELTPMAGREHYAKAMVSAFAGAGVRGGRAIGATDREAANVTEFGWGHKRPIYMEDVAATIYSVLGIDWSKRIRNTPSGRDFVYVDPASSLGFLNVAEASEFFA
jgi:hypothetical protein